MDLSDSLHPKYITFIVCRSRCLDLVDNVGHCSLFWNVSQSVGIMLLPVLKALDLWAMGVTLYCFVFGKASSHFLCSTKVNSEGLDECLFHIFSCLLEAPSCTVVRTLSITIFMFSYCSVPVAWFIWIYAWSRLLLLFLLVVLRDAYFLWHSNNSLCLACVFPPAVPIYWWVHIGFAQ